MREKLVYLVEYPLCVELICQVEAANPLIYWSIVRKLNKGFYMV
jgi:hypothetical protein